MQELPESSEAEENLFEIDPVLIEATAKPDYLVGAVPAAHSGKNSEIIAAASKLYIADGARVADVTWGKGAFWNYVDITRFQLLASDLYPRQIKKWESVPVTKMDFCALEYDDESLDVIVLYPPYIHNPGNAGKRHIMDDNYVNARTTAGMYHSNIIDLYERGMQEAWRKLKPWGTLWVKCKDQVEGGMQRWAQDELVEIGTKIGFYKKDLFFLVTQLPNGRRWKVQHHARKNLSYLIIFQKMTKKERQKLTKPLGRNKITFYEENGTFSNHERLTVTEFFGAIKPNSARLQQSPSGTP